MQSFDQELERLINEGVFEREVALSYATNAPNLALRLDTTGKDAEKKAAGPSIALKDGGRPGVRTKRPDPTPDLGMDDLIER